MQLYHGNYTEISVIDLKKAKPYKDFGRAFYLTKYYKQAEIWTYGRLMDENTELYKKLGKKYMNFWSWVESVEGRIQHSEILIVKYANPHI